MPPTSRPTSPFPRTTHASPIGVTTRRAKLRPDSDQAARSCPRRTPSTDFLAAGRSRTGAGVGSRSSRLARSTPRRPAAAPPEGAESGPSAHEQCRTRPEARGCNHGDAGGGAKRPAVGGGADDDAPPQAGLGRSARGALAARARRPLDLADEIVPLWEPAADLSLGRLDQPRTDASVQTFEVRELDQPVAIPTSSAFKPCKCA